MRIFNYHQRCGGFVITISEHDIERVCNGANLPAVILEKMRAITYQQRTTRKTSSPKRASKKSE
jgi:hypothetical protein